jgi:hypothetical protein
VTSAKILPRKAAQPQVNGQTKMALNARGVRTARGGRWHVSNVKNVIDRAGRLL